MTINSPIVLMRGGVNVECHLAVILGLMHPQRVIRGSVRTHLGSSVGFIRPHTFPIKYHGFVLYFYIPISIAGLWK